jgi:hypothetical protein
MTDEIRNNVYNVNVSIEGLCNKDDIKGGQECRDYNLNENKSLKKILQATERDEIEILHTGGGIKLTVNAGTYQLLKSAVRDYFGKESDSLSCTRIPVTDKKGNLVETKYKLASGKSHLYTLNMYHTTCSCLVNGRKAEEFVETDLPAILNMVETAVIKNNTTLGQFNTDIKDTLLHHFDDTSERSMSTSTEINNYEIMTTIEAVSVQSENDQVLNISTSADGKNQCDCDNENERKAYEQPSNCILSNIEESIAELYNLLKQHIDDTGLRFAQIQDQMQCIKTQAVTNVKSVSHQIECVTDSTQNIQSELTVATTTIQRRLQSISDHLKSQK